MARQWCEYRSTFTFDLWGRTLWTWNGRPVLVTVRDVDYLQLHSLGLQAHDLVHAQLFDPQALLTGMVAVVCISEVGKTRWVMWMWIWMWM